MRRAIRATNPAPACRTSANRLFSIPVAIQSTLHPVAHANAAQDWTIEDRMYPPRTAALQSPPARPANGARARGRELDIVQTFMHPAGDFARQKSDFAKARRAAVKNPAYPCARSACIVTRMRCQNVWHTALAYGQY